MCHCKNGILSNNDIQKVKDFVKAYADTQGALIPILHEVQESFGYIPYDAMRIIADGLNIPITEVYGVVTFYSRFTLKPTGKYTVSVCMGTACYVKGSDRVLDRIEKKLGIRAGDSTDDGLYTIEATRCVGACGLAPIMTVNGEVYGKVTPDEVDQILEKYK